VKHEARNPKTETSSKSEGFNIPNGGKAADVLNIGDSSLRACCGFIASDFGFESDGN
jgi:hypothetical protein